ncbi:hypothetical protein CMsap09_13075 [Clavibacter michiganensis]|uniref:Uncharacterized protein n=1 Tax=Clavibacter michiganensis TaxID=28447 RepID=A0A251XX93_9MICO|nr:hypothetical protein CMsap09_13075 [Clavibacter michiganensis]
MTSEDRPSYLQLLTQLFHAGEEEAFETDGMDPRQTAFEKLVRSIDHALGGNQVLYCTHSFSIRDAPNAPLEGRAIAFTSSLVATVDVGPGSDHRVVVTPLSSLVAIAVDEHRDTRFLGLTAWEGHRVSLRFDGPKNTALLVPGVPSSDTNARDFAAFYPALLDALRTR